MKSVQINRLYIWRSNVENIGDQIKNLHFAALKRDCSRTANSLCPRLTEQVSSPPPDLTRPCNLFVHARPTFWLGGYFKPDLAALNALRWALLGLTLAIFYLTGLGDDLNCSPWFGKLSGVSEFWLLVRAERGICLMRNVFDIVFIAYSDDRFWLVRATDSITCSVHCGCAHLCITISDALRLSRSKPWSVVEWVEAHWGKEQRRKAELGKI